jgi:hypothetical protein
MFVTVRDPSTTLDVNAAGFGKILAGANYAKSGFSCFAAGQKIPT